MRSNPIPAPMGLTLAIFRRRLETGGYKDKSRASSAIERAKQFTDGERAAAHRMNGSYWNEQQRGKVEQIGSKAETIVRTTSKALQRAREDRAAKSAKLQAAREQREAALTRVDGPPSHLRVVPDAPPSEVALPPAPAAPERPRDASKLAEVTAAMAIAQSGLQAIAAAMKEAGAPEAMPALLSAAQAVAVLAHRAAELTQATASP